MNGPDPVEISEPPIPPERRLIARSLDRRDWALAVVEYGIAAYLICLGLNAQGGRKFAPVAYILGVLIALRTLGVLQNSKAALQRITLFVVVCGYVLAALSILLGILTYGTRHDYMVRALAMAIACLAFSWLTCSSGRWPHDERD